MLSNAYFLAKIRFDTAENEPAKNLKIFEKFAKLVKKICVCNANLKRRQFVVSARAGLFSPPPQTAVPRFFRGVPGAEPGEEGEADRSDRAFDLWLFF